MTKLLPAILLVFITFWVIIFFMALPVGVKVPNKPDLGHADSAPEDSKLWLKTLITSLLAGICTALFVWWKYYR